MQNGVSITTKDSELNIIYGMINVRTEREDARSSVRYILTDLNDIRKKYFLLGFHLQEFSRMKYYEDFGYTTLEEFCEKNFGMDKSTVSRCINVCLEFHKKENCGYGVKTGEYLLGIDDRWKEYSYSQLVEMIPLSDDQRRMVKPEMSIKQIRDFKKSLKKKPEKTDDKEVAMSQPETTANSLSFSDISSLSGAALQSKIKKAPDKISGLLYVFDKNGKQLMRHLGSLILEDDGNYCFRLFRSIEEIEKDKKKPEK